MNADTTREVFPSTHPSNCGRAALATSTRRLLVGAALSLTLLPVWAGSAQAMQSPIPAAGFPQTNPGATISAIAVAPDGNTVYVGGDFSSFGGQTRTKLAAFNLSTGQVLPWAPTVGGGGAIPIERILATASTVYVAGNFVTINATVRQSLAKIGTSGSGTLDPFFNSTLAPSASVYGLKLTTDGSLFVGGSFTNIGPAARANIAKLNSTTGAADSSWNPGGVGANGIVKRFILSGNDLYVGGQFLQFGGLPRVGLAKVSTSGIGTVDPTWNPTASAGPIPDITALLLSGSDLYVGGTFTSMGGQPRTNLAKVSTTGTGATDASWSPIASAPVRGLGIMGGNVYAAGDFFTIAGAARNYLVALDPTTGTATSWFPNPNSCNSCAAVSIKSLAVAGTTVIAGGNFQTFGAGNSATVSYGLAVLGDVLPPDNTEPPSIAGTPETQATLTCNKGTWSSPGATVDYSYQWMRDGRSIGQAPTREYTVTTDDYGTELSCAVTASNLGGSTSKTSAPVTVSKPASVPTGSDSGTATVPKVRTRILSSLGQLLRDRELTLKVGCNMTLSTRIAVFTTGIRQIRLATATVSCDGAGSQEVVAKVRDSAVAAVRRAVDRGDLKRVDVRVVARVTDAEPSRTRGVLRLAG